MPAARWDIVIEEGSDFDLSVRWMEDDCVPKDISSYGAKMQVREEKDPGSQVLHEASTDNGQIVIEASEGRFYIKIPDEETSNPPVDWEKAHWDLKVWPVAADPTENPKRLVEGRARYSKQVTV